MAHGQHLRIFACAIANDSGMFLGGSSNGSGLYQSDDTGKTWKHLGWENIKCYSMDEVNSSNGRILYEATGLGILRSTDYGAHWKQLTDWRISEVMDIAVNQKNPTEIYIATAHGPWRTEDGGKTWEQLLDGLPVPYCSSVVIDSVIPNHVVLGSEQGIFSLDTGNYWTRVPCEQRNYHNAIEKEITAPTRSIIQVSRNEWRAVTAQSRQLGSFDSAKNFGTSSLGRDESLYCVCEVYCLRREVAYLGKQGWYVGAGWVLRLIGGPGGADATQYEDDERMGWQTNDIKNVTSCLLVVDTANGWQKLNYCTLLGSLNGGIYRWDSKTCTGICNGTFHLQKFEKFLPGRQIWTLKSFLVTP